MMEHQSIELRTPVGSGGAGASSPAAERRKARLDRFVSFSTNGEKDKPKPPLGIKLCMCMREVFHPWTVPAAKWLRRYNWREDLVWDFNAGLVVGILLIPQGMAYALLANQSPIHGLYCAIIPNIIYAMLGTSRESAVGAMALVSIMVGDMVTALAPNRESAKSREEVAIRLAFLTGLVQILLGSLRLGTIANYVSHPVMVGFCTAGEILIAVSQLKYLLGIKVPQFLYAYQTLGYLLRHLNRTAPYTLLMGLLTFVPLYLLSKWKRVQRENAERDPALARNRRLRTLRVLANFGPFLAIFLTSIFSYLMLTHWGVRRLDVIGKVPQGFQVFAPLAMSANDFKSLMPSAVILAVVSYMLSFSVAKKYATASQYDIDPSQELLAMGVADFVGSFFGAFPVAGGFARTAVNVEAGARSQVSSLVSALLVALAVNFLTNTFRYIPMCSLAAIVQVAICNVLDFSPYVKAWRMSKVEFSVMLTTFIVTLILGIDKGIMAGVVISIVVLIRSSTLPQIKVLGRLPEANVFRDCCRYPNAQQYPGIRILRVDESLNFASCTSIKEQILRLSGALRGVSLRPQMVVLECSGVNHLDLSGVRMLDELRDTLKRQRQHLYLSSCKAKVRDKLRRAGLFEAFGGRMLYLSLPALLATLVEDEQEQEALAAAASISMRQGPMGEATACPPVTGAGPSMKVPLLLHEDEEDDGIDWYI